MSQAQQEPTEKNANVEPQVSQNTSPSPSQESGSSEAPAPAINVEEIAKAVRESLKAEGIGQKGGESISQEDVTKLLHDHKRELAARILGEEQESGDVQLRKAMLLEPERFITGLSKIIEDRASERWEADLARRDQEAAAANHVLKTRPELTEAEREMVNENYASEENKDPDASPMELAKRALEKFDLRMERLGLGTAEERKSKRATSIDSAGSPSKGQQDDGAKNDEEVIEAELAERKARHKQLRNL